MNELTTINNDQVVVSSRQIAENFEKRHDHVLRTITDLLKDAPKIGEMFFDHQEPDSYGRKQKVYLMNRDGFSILVMGFTGAKALEWKLKYIEAFNKMEQILISKAPSYQISDPIERAKVWIQEQEERKALEQDIKALEPAKIFSDAVSGSEDTILVRELAVFLKQNGVDTGEKRLFETLRRHGYVIKREG
ncbi:MAG TPA: phage regulatory protein/antirepressor Ant, partial [Clostridiaceae bacterium]|nr:phage regulatory protein/antirepressor Ant [Clostridiaceae bacterium]